MTHETTAPDLDETYDVVVVGGGAAGLAGALCLARARRSVLVVDDGTPRNAPAGHVHNYLTRDGTPPAELVAIGRAEAAGYGAAFRDATATDVVRLGAARRGAVGDRSTDEADPPDAAVAPHARFALTLSDGTRVAARRLLVTTGLRDELPDVRGLAAHWGAGVLHCPFCHGWEVRDRPVVVVSSGPLTAHQALLWSHWTSDLTVVGPVAADRVEELEARGVRLVDGRAVAVVEEDGRLAGLRLDDGGVVACEAVVVAARAVGRSALLERLGVATQDMVVEGHSVGTFVPVGPDGSTGVEGVWAAGNVANPRAQVITSAAAGLEAAAAITADLLGEETRHLVAARRAASAARSA